VKGIAQKPIEGVSMAYSFDDPAAKDRRRTQYFEMLTNRAIYDHGWVAASRFGVPLADRWARGRFPRRAVGTLQSRRGFQRGGDLAAKHPDKLKKLKAKFDEEAKKHDVYPLDPADVGAVRPETA
jgi:arylsulfatase A-like enzyme